jgi:2',3'-cyclic-nucleotide 2'-phosphodiesterase (5'-nucleotidase family)
MKHTSIFTVSALALALVAPLGRASAQPVGAAGVEIAGAGSRSQETTAGNLVADALKASTNADAAIVAGGGIASGSLRRGPLTVADLKNLFEDPDDGVAVITLTGAQLWVALERSVSVHPKPFDGFLQVSGLSVEFDSGRPPGPRLLKVKVNGVSLDPNKKYRVATLSTLAGGALGYYRMWAAKDVAQTGRTVSDTLASYVQAQKTISPRVESRLAPKS